MRSSTALYDLGVAAEAWRADLLPVLYPPRNVHDVACLPNGLRVRGLRGEPIHWVPWDAIELVSAGRIEQADELRVIAPPSWVQAVSTGLNALLHRPSRLARRERSMRVSREPVGELIVVRRDPRIALRVAEDAMNYAYLGDRKQATASENFLLFLTDLCGARQPGLRHPPDPRLAGGRRIGGRHLPEFAGLDGLLVPPPPLELVSPRPGRPEAVRLLSDRPAAHSCNRGAACYSTPPWILLPCGRP